VKKAKLLALQRDTSLSGLLRSALEDAVRGNETYEARRRRALRRLDTGFYMGTAGPYDWTKDESHERQD
jgi:hypothetical protein